MGQRVVGEQADDEDDPAPFTFRAAKNVLQARDDRCFKLLGLGIGNYGTSWRLFCGAFGKALKIGVENTRGVDGGGSGRAVHQ